MVLLLLCLNKIKYTLWRVYIATPIIYLISNFRYCFLLFTIFVKIDFLYNLKEY